MFRKAKAAEGAQILPWHQTFAVGIIMSMLAGYLEAYTYTLRGNVFCNGQTSNIALMMINFFRGNTAKALYYPIPILAFFFGTVFAALLRSRRFKLRWARVEMLIFALEFALLFIVGFIPQGAGDTVVNIMVTFTTAVQYEVFREARGLSYASIFCTGNLRTAAEYFSAFIGQRDRKAGATCARYLMIIGSFAVGAFASAWLSTLWNVRSVWVGCLLLIAIIPLMVRSRKA